MRNEDGEEQKDKEWKKRSRLKEVKQGNNAGGGEWKDEETKKKN